MENENITLNEASIFYKRIDKDTYLIGKDKDSFNRRCDRSIIILFD